MANNSKEEPKTAPQSDRWYDLKLGPSFKEQSSNKFCTLRYEFKPASIDKTKPGLFHKNKDNRVSVEFQNNQLGKPKVTFEGSSEDYKENDAVLFFDGQTFRLERLHRAVKQLRHLRLPGESASAAQSLPAVDAPGLSPPVGKGVKPIHIGRSSIPPVPPVPVEVERIDVGEQQVTGTKAACKGITEQPIDPLNLPTSAPSPKNDESEEHQDIDIEDIFGAGSPEDGNTIEEKADGSFGVDAPQQNDTDDEIADVEDSDEEAGKGPNAAETLKAQVNAGERDEQTSSSSSGSESGSSGSGSGSGSSSSGSSSSDSEGSGEDSVNSI